MTIKDIKEALGMYEGKLVTSYGVAQEKDGSISINIVIASDEEREQYEQFQKEMRARNEVNSLSSLDYAEGTID